MRVALVVDDDPAVLELLAEMLVELGCEVITQQDSAAALAVLAQDQRIGQELAKQAKRLRPGVKPILISGRETHGHGFPLLRKPLLQAELGRLIRETVGF